MMLRGSALLLSIVACTPRTPERAPERAPPPTADAVVAPPEVSKPTTATVPPTCTSAWRRPCIAMAATAPKAAASSLTPSGIGIARREGTTWASA